MPEGGSYIWALGKWGSISVFPLLLSMSSVSLLAASLKGWTRHNDTVVWTFSTLCNSECRRARVTYEPLASGAQFLSSLNSSLWVVSACLQLHSGVGSGIMPLSSGHCPHSALGVPEGESSIWALGKRGSISVLSLLLSMSSVSLLAASLRSWIRHSGTVVWTLSKVGNTEWRKTLPSVSSTWIDRWLRH